MKKLDFTPVCEKCGAVAPVDTEKSTENYIVYAIKNPCKCGGTFKSRCLLER